MESGGFDGEIMPLLEQAYNFARFLCGNADAASSIVQTAFLDANRDSLMCEKRAPARLLKIVRERYLAWLLDVRQMRVPNGFTADVSLSDEDRYPDVDAVRFAIETMPRRLREVWVLRELENLSYSEIS